MKRSIVLILSIVSLLLVSCAANKSQDPNNPFLGGTQGIVMSFLPGLPPSEIYDAGNSNFGVGVQLQNLGESAVGPDAPGLETTDKSQNTYAAVNIIGINPAQYGFPVLQHTFQEEGITLLGSRKSGIDGSIFSSPPSAITFDNFQYMPDIRGTQTVPLQAELCYDYTTYTNTQVCIKDDVLENTLDNSVCVLSEPKTVQNSGAPVHVTSMVETPAGKNKIQVTFTVENVGTGQVFRRSEDQALSSASPCDPNVQNPNHNKVYVKAFMNTEGSDYSISCPQLNNGAEGYVDLFGGSAATVNCEIITNPSNNRVFEDTFYVYLQYTYYDKIMTDLTIRDNGVGQSN